AAAVALENIRIIEERGLVDNASAAGAVLQRRLRELADHPLVGEVRGVGLIAAVELVADKASRAPFDPAGKAGALAGRQAQDDRPALRGLQARVAVCPPLIIAGAQVGARAGRFAQSLEETAKKL